jgi:protein-S-isoprenylcysteine O-methyltransferase Ste14
MVAHSLAFGALLGLLLFLPAGTLARPQAWVFMALFIGCSEAIGVWLKKSDPDLLAARMKSPISADQKFSDRAVMSAILVVFIGWFGFMAVDARRCGWSHTPLWARALGAALIVGAFYGWVGVLRANSFAAVTVRLQEERGQTVISTGPYAVVRHPMYAYAVLLMIGAPLPGLALGSPGRGIAPTAVGGSCARRGGHAPGRAAEWSLPNGAADNRRCRSATRRC